MSGDVAGARGGDLGGTVGMEGEDTTPVTDTQAYFIGLLIYTQTHTMIVSRLTYRYCCFCYLWY